MAWLKRYFELDAHRTTVTAEIRAGTSTFLTMDPGDGLLFPEKVACPRLIALKTGALPDIDRGS
jgi:hypothetical protein